MKAMALARSQRWRDAKEMAEALVEGEAAPLQPTAERPVVIEKPAVPARTRELPEEEAAAPAKRGWIWIVAAVVIVAALAAGGWWLYQSGLLTGGTEVAQATLPPAATKVSAVDTEVPDATAKPTDVPQPTAAVTSPPSASDKAQAFAESILAGIGARSPDYEDGFGDPGSGWTLVKTSDIETAYQDGEYVVITSPNYPAFADSTSLPAFADFVLEVDGRFAAGEVGYWGASWQWGDAQVTSVLLPFLAGPVQMVHCEGADCSSLGDIRNPALNPVSETNHLQIIVKGAEIAVAINGEWQVLATDLHYTTDEGRRTRFDVVNSGTSPLEVRWDNLKIWDITDLPAPTD
jgi:hypothetical protein